ncbi:right-handed parallel beta-helix repeat-containing protein [Sphingomonas sp. AOB5]|uniref:right-handed parallel beta-helix repeat-containing protein n=1 Tax=Sphingomonas sp. AOB5 TaxID=3034017 RepID=UPI0023F7BFEA|nr:right-handed parallel beta-helix repeat-containing protein [Sphingomonas sp. AOB5]MDF7775953.1 right-handed parallel beta-helix repeat-containing protein [Sphingomonas sp. AOB5]
MKHLRLLCATAIAATSIGIATPAAAQATRTWISGVGDDVNPCSRTAPCKTFAGAISKTATGGEINCLDPGGFGSVTITKAITLDCGGGEGGWPGSILNSSVPGINVNTTSDPNAKVIIRNLSINGGPNLGTYGIRVIVAGSVTIENVTIENQGLGGTGAAVSWESSTANSELNITKSYIYNNTVGGVIVKSNGGVATSAVLTNVTISNNLFGVRAADGSAVTVTGGAISHNTQFGVQAFASTGATLSVEGTTIASNGKGVSTSGAAATVRLSNTGIYNNTTGIDTSFGGSVISFGNNRIAGNTTPGAPTSTTPQQ